MSMRFPDCIYGAPYLYKPSKGSAKGSLSRACCNHWDCPRCGQARAKHEYGRIVEGARKLRAQGSSLYFVTITMRGDANSETYQLDYLEATNRLLSSWRNNAKRRGGKLEYVQITEFQKRGVPHSHLIATDKPEDAFFITDEPQRYRAEVARVNAAIPVEMRYAPLDTSTMPDTEMMSYWLQTSAVKAGLGVQARISLVDQVEGASRYVAKYMFKSLTEQSFPKKWRRVRYSQGFPKLPEQKDDEVIAIVRRADWHQVRDDKGEVVATSVQAFEAARRQICLNVTIDSDLAKMVNPALK